MRPTLCNRCTSTLLLLLVAVATAASDVSVDGVIHGSECTGVPCKERIRRDMEIRQKLNVQTPVAVRKLSADEGEKFWLDYWQFPDGDRLPGDGGQEPHAGDPNKPWDLEERGTSDQDLWHNISHFQAPYALHHDDGHPPRNLPRWIPEGLRLAKRNFECPAGSFRCTSIDRPNSCCSNGATCQIVPDTGLGDVGCCPSNAAGRRCSGQLTSCGEGQSSCPNNPGGGCCVPGYSCVDQGCIFAWTTTVTPTPTPRPTSTRPSTSEEISTPPSASPTTTPSPSPSETETIAPPWRPTSNPPTSTSPSPPQSPTNIPGCPTGFYACSAVYHGGCCRTGRDCNPTSCPAIPSTTVVNSNGVTVVVPVATTTAGAGTGGGCAGGWMACPDDVGGGCCPGGFVCGEVDCTISGGNETVGKTPQSNGVSGGGMVTWNVLFALCMTILLFRVFGF